LQVQERFIDAHLPDLIGERLFLIVRDQDATRAAHGFT